MKSKYWYFSAVSALFLTFVTVPHLKAESGNSINTSVMESATVANSFISIDQGHYTTGRVRIIRDKGRNYLELDKAFSTFKAPNLRVILYRNSSVPFSIAQASDYISLAPLQNFSGKQRYLISDRIDLSQYSSVAIWCEQFNITFAYAALPQVSQIIASGDFISLQNQPQNKQISKDRTTGTASIIKEHGQQYLQFDDSFATKSDRNIKVVLHRRNSKSTKIKSQEYLSLASLKKPQGKQRYLLPKDINTKEYNQVVIWCENSKSPLGYAIL